MKLSKEKLAEEIADVQGDFEKARSSGVKVMLTGVLMVLASIHNSLEDR